MELIIIGTEMGKDVMVDRNKNTDQAPNLLRQYFRRDVRKSYNTQEPTDYSGH